MPHGTTGRKAEGLGDVSARVAEALAEDPPAMRAAMGAASTVGGDLTGSIALRSTAAGGLDTFDSTSRLTVESYQTNGNHFYGEGIRLDLMVPTAKNMIAWRMPVPIDSTDPEDMRSVVWTGAHYYAQDQPDPENPTDVHGHWSVEVPDAGNALRTRLEVKFVTSAGAIGLDKTLVQTASADLVVDTSNSQVLRLRSGIGAAKYIEWGNDQWGAAPRWKMGVPSGGTESGGNVGSDFEIRRYGDNNSTAGAPIAISRATGRTTLGGTDGSQSGLDVRRNTAGNAVMVYHTATGGAAYAVTAQDAATSRLVQGAVQGEAGTRAVLYADGKWEIGDGTNARDTNLYRSAANVLKTDDSLHVALDLRHLGTNLGFYGAAAAAKPAVTGSRAGNAALASMLTALAGLGLLTDSTTA